MLLNTESAYTISRFCLHYVALSVTFSVNIMTRNFKLGDFNEHYIFKIRQTNELQKFDSKRKLVFYNYIFFYNEQNCFS
jgi:hypothetical protein